MTGELTTAKLLTKQFYDWEQRRRGWHLAPYPVQLEPPFHPFFYHVVPSPYVDDGKRPTFLSRVAGLFKKPQIAPVVETYTEPALEYYSSEEFSELCVLQLALPKNYNVSHEAIMQLIVVLSNSRHHICFEIVATTLSITLQLTIPNSERIYVRNQIKAFIPQATIHDYPDAVETILHDGEPAYILDFGLRDEFMRPIATIRSTDHDPYVSLFGILNNLQDNEVVFIQILFSGTINAWADSIITSVSDGTGGSFFDDAPEMPGLAHEKTAQT